MTAYLSALVRCDSCGKEFDGDGGYRTTQALVVAAKRHGWSEYGRHSSWAATHLCPDCQKEAR